MQLALYTAVYPAAVAFLRAWYVSVVAQTDTQFDLWISLDGLDQAQAIAAFGAAPQATWLAASPGATVADVRQQAFELICQRYDAVVLVDCDDVLAPTRVAAARAALADHDLVGCALRVIDQDGRDCDVTFAPAERMELDALLPRYNVFGLSNTAYRCTLLKRCLPIPHEAVLTDWLLATRAWALGAKIVFDHRPHMFYRQYPTNTAAILPPFSPAQVRAATERVLTYYRLVLGEESWPLPAAHQAAILAAQHRAERFGTAIENPAMLERYCEQLNMLTPQYIWWWSVAHEALETLWTHST